MGQRRKHHGTPSSEIVRRKFSRVFSTAKRRPSQRRAGNDGYNDDDGKNDDFYQAHDDDDKYNDDDDGNNNDGDDAANGEDDMDDIVAGVNELCSEFLVSFLEGTTDARDTCEGIMNAYTAAECEEQMMEKNVHDDDDDDFFEAFTEHQCCQALMAHHAEYCEEGDLLSNAHLFVAASVLLMCECAKALVTYYHIHFLPEAATCILVGTLVGLVSHLLPFTDLNELSFDDELFLILLLPPIIFEAALSVSKTEFKRRRGAILMFSVFGTIISTFATGFMVHYLSKVSNATTFPMLDSLVFGALISSIDPVAILSVLTSLHLDQKDTIFILVFGESLLNDGIAITVFQTLVDRFDGKTNDGTTSLDEVLDAVATFMIAMFGSIMVGLACGAGALIYYNVLGTLLPPVMEVGSFFLWALIPYYICDGVGWSGIVSIVVVGFFMDIYIAGPKKQPRPPENYKNMVDDSGFQRATPSNSVAPSFDLATVNSVDPLPELEVERIHLSATANKHIRFVAHLTAQLAENAIFAYMGLFLFSNNYEWNPTLVTIATASCILSRALMVAVVSKAIFQIYKCRRVGPNGKSSSRTAAAINDKRTQAVLVLAGLRGAVSLALVENVPIYNNVTGEGCEFKQLMKGMTSAAILFTTFVFGGGAYFVLPWLGVSQDREDDASPTFDINPGATHA